MTMRRSLGELRRAVLRTNDLVDGVVSPVPDEAARIDLLHRASQALSAASPTPPELASPEFLAAIHERAAKASAKAIGPRHLRELAAPMTAPADVTWVEPRPSLVVARMAGSPVGPVPGWLRLSRREAAPRRRRVALASAAAILLAALTLRAFHGTPAEPDFVFVAVDRPLSLDHPSDWLRALADVTR